MNIPNIEAILVWNKLSFNMLYYTDRGWDIAWCKTNGPLQMDLFLQFPTLQNLNIDPKSDQRSILELRIQIVRQNIH